MKDDSFILVSLKDGKSKKLAQVVTNDSCRKILDYLGRQEDSTESQIAKAINLPISTVHYNIKQLVDARFLKADEFHYSEKGKEMIHYKLANKFIVIAPQKTFGFKQKLREILPVALIGGAVSLALKIISLFQSKFISLSSVKGEIARPAAFIDASKSQVVSGAGESAELIADSAHHAVETVVSQTYQASPHSIFSVIALWFFLGVIFAILLFLFFEWFRTRKNV